MVGNVVVEDLGEGPQGRLFVVRVKGDLDWAAGNEVSAAGRRLLDGAGEPFEVVVNLAETSFADTTGLHSVAALMTAFEGDGHVARLTVSPAVSRLLERIRALGRPTDADLHDPSDERSSEPGP